MPRFSGTFSLLTVLLFFFFFVGYFFVNFVSHDVAVEALEKMDGFKWSAESGKVLAARC